MSATYTLFSPLTPKQMLELAALCQHTLEEFLEQHPDCEDEWGEMSAGGHIPREEEVVLAYSRYALPLDPEVLKRLARCRSTLTIERPGDIDTRGGLQVSILRFLLERIGDGMALLNDYPFESSQQLLARLKKKKAAKGFGGEPAPKASKKVARREAKPGEVRALRVLGTLQRAMSDVRVAIDVKGTLHEVSEAARNYGALLLEEGAVTDVKAAKALGMSQAELTAAADELDLALSGRSVTTR
jgi:hypothetical protein